MIDASRRIDAMPDAKPLIVDPAEIERILGAQAWELIRLRSQVKALLVENAELVKKLTPETHDPA